MKKLMIAAAVAAVGAAAFGGACQPTTPDTAWAYVWKFTGKTTTGNKAASTGGACYTGDTCTYRVPSSLKIQGYTYACAPAVCAEDALGFETQFAECNEVFYMTKPYKASMYGGVTTEIAHIIGKSKKQVEIQGVAKLTEGAENSTFTLTYAGLGKLNLANKRVTSASGNFAGTLSQPWAYIVKKDICIKAGYWRCDTLALECEGPSVAYGKWSVKYNKAASKKFLSGITIKMPAWVQWLNGACTE
jgi:hypothetical protein